MPSRVSCVCDASWPSSEIVCVASLSSLDVETLTPESLLSAPARSSESRRCGEFASMLLLEMVADDLAVTWPMTLSPLFSIAKAKLTVTTRPLSTSNDAEVRLS